MILLPYSDHGSHWKSEAEAVRWECALRVMLVGLVGGVGEGETALDSGVSREWHDGEEGNRDIV